MKKLEFLMQLHDKLPGLPKEDKAERLEFYSEMIEDRMEEGLSEEEAVAQIGSVDDIAAQIIADTPLSRLVKENIRPKKRRKVWQTVLLAAGSPLWLSLLIAAFAVGISLYAALWAVVISLWAVFASLAACALGFTLGGGILYATGNGSAGGLPVAAALVCAGLSVFMFYGCKAATKGSVILTGKIILGIKHCFIKKGCQ